MQHVKKLSNSLRQEINVAGKSQADKIDRLRLSENNEVSRARDWQQNELTLDGRGGGGGWRSLWDLLTTATASEAKFLCPLRFWPSIFLATRRGSRANSMYVCLNELRSHEAKVISFMKNRLRYAKRKNIHTWMNTFVFALFTRGDWTNRETIIFSMLVNCEWLWFIENLEIDFLMYTWVENITTIMYYNFR